MPTGYTTPVLKGATFEEFVWDCVRAFVPDCKETNGPIALPLRPDDQYQKAYADEARRDYDRCMSLSDEQLLVSMRDEYTDAKRRHDEGQRGLRAENAILEAMMAKVQAWDPPKEIEEIHDLKAYMLDQLQSSMHTFYKFNMPFPQLVDVKKYREHAATWKRDREADLAKLHDRYVERNAWLAELAKSVPPTGKGKLR